MPSKHSKNPVTFRPPAADRAWLYEHAEETGRSAGSILSQALAEYRERAKVSRQAKAAAKEGRR